MAVTIFTALDLPAATPPTSASFHQDGSPMSKDVQGRPQSSQKKILWSLGTSPSSSLPWNGTPSRTTPPFSALLAAAQCRSLAAVGRMPVTERSLLDSRQLADANWSARNSGLMGGLMGTTPESARKPHET